MAAPRETAAAIDAAAARWVARLDAAPDDPVLRGAVDAWAAADPRRRGALLRAQAAWTVMAGDDAALEAQPIASTKPVSRRRIMIGLAGVGSAVAAGVAGWLAIDHEQSFATRLGEQHRTRLADGSTMLLNTLSQSRVAITDTQRRVELDAGEAWFQVAKDKKRPFVVAAGDVRVEAVGTAFAVRRLAGRAEVVVTEGRVRVWSVANPARFLSLDAGRRAIVADVAGAGSATVDTGGIDQALAWRRGVLVLDGMTLGDAAAEFNRYNRRQLSVEAPLAEHRMVGWFRTDDIEGFATAAATIAGGRIEQDDATIRIVE